MVIQEQGVVREKVILLKKLQDGKAAAAEGEVGCGIRKTGLPELITINLKEKQVHNYREWRLKAGRAAVS